MPTGAGQVTITGGQVATGVIGANVIRTNSLAANTFTIQIQRSTAVAASDSTKNGVCHFDSAMFSVDANGFVTNTAAGGFVQTLTGNSGGAISPTLGNINTVGTGSITISGAGSTLTTQLNGLNNHAVLIGSGTPTITNVGPVASTGSFLASNGLASDPGFSTATYPLTTTINQILYSSAANTVVGLATANRAVLTTGATGIPVLTALATDGQLIIGSTAGVPAAATLTAGTGISITNGSNSITVAVNGAVVGQTITGDTGGALSPTAGNWNLLGSGSITTSGAGSTLTTQLTGLTNHAVLVGAGTTTITKIAATANTGAVLQNNSGADPSYSTATYPSTTTVSQILYSSATNVVSGLATANRAVVTTNSTGVPVVTALATDGQLIIGSTAGAPAAATITAGTGITVTNASNSITIAASGSSGFTTINVQKFTTSGTYTPTANMKYCQIVAVGGGGAGGGTAASPASSWSAGPGGGGGGTSFLVASAATIGASKTVTIGAGGTPGAAGNNAGGNGGDTSLGTLCIGKGGTGGPGTAGTNGVSGGAGGIAGTGDYSIPGQAGSNVYPSVDNTVVGAGGASGGGYGYGGQSTTTAGTGANGNAGQLYGGAGSGGSSFTGLSAFAGGAGAAGIVIVTEFI